MMGNVRAMGGGRGRFNAEDADAQRALRRGTQEHRQECLCHKMYALAKFSMGVRGGIRWRERGDSDERIDTGGE
jgi:hypothetical protein